MAEQDVLPSPPEPRRHPLPGLKRLSDRTPLRTKLITAVLGLVILALAAISLTGVYVLRSYLTTAHDPQITGVFHGIQRDPGDSFDGKAPNTSYPVQGNVNVFAGVQEPGSKLSPPTGGPYLGGGGQMPNSRQQSAPSIPTTSAWAKANNGQLLTVNSQAGPDTWRVITAPITVGDVSGTLVVGYDLGDIGSEIRRLAIIDVVVSAAVVGVLAVIAVGLVRTNLRPLDDIELTAGQIAKGHLDHRVPEGDPRTEVGSLSRSLNAMLAQIERAFNAQQESEQAAHHSEERMRRFIADASHELRTPLTTIRGFAAHYRQRGGASGSTDNLSPDDLDHLMARVESEATRMGLLVEDLLTLARLDQQRPLAKAPVDLLTVVADAVQDARIVSPGRPIDLTVAPGTAFLVDGDEPRLRQVLGNLVNNAITHTPDGTPVKVTISRGTIEDGEDGGPAVVLDVADEGPGMSADQAQRVFERFYRADAARNRASGGTGLGLAIVAGLVSAHGGTVSLRTAPGQGADFQVKLPLSPDALADDDEADDEGPV